MPIDPNNVVWDDDTGSDVRAEALDFYIRKGWAPHISAGIVANFDYESGGLNPNAVGDGGKSFGIGQWNGPRREALFKYAGTKGEKTPSLQTQLEFSHLELVGPEAQAGELLKTARTPEEATQIFSEHYERPGKPMMKSRLSRAADIVAKFLGPSEAMAAESDAPNLANVEWDDDSSPSSVEWDEADDKSFGQKWMEEFTNQRFSPTQRQLGIGLGIGNVTLAAPMAVFRAYNKNKDKASQMSFLEQMGESGQEILRSSWESISEEGKWGASSADAWETVLGKPLDQALPENLQWAAPAITTITDILSDPAVGMTAVGRKMWEGFAKSVVGDDLFKDLSKVGKLPELRSVKIPQQVLDDFARLERLDAEEKKVVANIINNPPPIQRGDPNFPRPQGEAGAIRKPTVTPDVRPPGIPLDPIQRAQLDLSPDDIARAQIQRGTGMQPSPVADVRPQVIETPTPAQRTMQIVNDAAQQAEALRRRGPAPIQRGAVAQSPIGDVRPVQQQTPAPMQRIMDMIEEQRRMNLGEAAPMPQRAAPIPDEAIAARLREVLPEPVAQKIVPEPQAAPKVAPEVIETAQGTRLQKDVDMSLVDQIKRDLEARKAATQEAPPTTVKKPEPGAPASQISDSHLVNSETMGQVEQRILSGNKGIREELGKIYDERIKAEGEGGANTFQDWMNPQKIGGRIYKEMRDSGLDHKAAQSRLKDLMKDYESKYREVLDAKKTGSTVEAAGAKEGIEGGDSGRIRVRDDAGSGVEAKEGAKEKVKQPFEMTRDEWGTQLAQSKKAERLADLDAEKARVQSGDPLYVGKMGRYKSKKQGLEDIKAQREEAMRLSPENVTDEKGWMHKDHVNMAHMDNKPIPPEVLKDYPDLKPTKGKSAIDILKSEKGAITIERGPSDKAIRSAMKGDADYQKLQGMYGEEKKRRNMPTLDAFMREGIDRFHPIKADTPETYSLARRYSSVRDVSQLDFNKLKDGLHKVRNNFDTFRDFVTARRAETRAKMFRESTTKPDVANAQKVKGQGTTPTKWVWQVQNPNDMKLDEAQRIQQKLLNAWEKSGGSKKDLIEAADFWDNWTKENILDVAKRTGFISNEAYANIRAANDHYATFSIMDYLPDPDNVPMVKSGEYFSLANQDIIKPIKGTTKKMADPVEATVQKYLATQYKAAKNDVAKSFRDEIINSTDPNISGQMRPIATSNEDFKRMTDAGLTPFAEGTKLPDDMTRISLFDNGKVEHWAVKKEWGDVLKHLNDVQVAKVIQVSNDVFKKGVTTAWLPFGITQIGIDSLAAFTTSPVYKWHDIFGRYQLDYLRGLMSGISQEFLGKSAKADRYFRSGGGLGFYGTLNSSRVGKEQLFKKALLDAEAKEIGATLVKKAADIPYKVLVGFPSKVVGAFEHAPRLAVFERALKQGRTPAEAALLARDATIDFYKAGNKTRIANMWIPFLNARIQGKYNLLNAAALREGGRTDTWAKLMAGVGVPFLATWAWNHRYFKDHYNNIDSHIKDNYVIFIYGETKDKETGKMVPKYLKFPKGDIGQAIINPWEHVLDVMSGKEPKSTSEAAAQWLADLVLPIQTMNEGEFDFFRTVGSVTPPLAKAVVENVANRNLYTGRDIDPKWMLLENVPPHLREKKSTPESYKAVTKYIYDKTGVSISPNKAQNVFGNILGGYGRTGFDPKQLGEGFTERFVSTKATGNINRAAKVYYQIDSDYQQLRYTAIDMVKNGKGRDAQQMLLQWNQNLGDRLSDMNKFGYRDKGGARRDYTFTSEKIRNIIQKGRESDKPSDWLEERLQRRNRRR